MTGTLATTGAPRTPLLAVRVAGALLVALLPPASAARAEVTPVPVPLSAPIAQGSTEVPYPAGVKGEAAVLLELVVEKDGTVSSAQVVEGPEPFAELARRAALEWRFAPARRGETPVAARIRARVDFHEQQPPPPAPSPAPAAAPPAAPAPAPPTAPEPTLEVTVRGQRHEIGETTLSADDVREMPGAFGDPFRAIEALPGVTPILSGLPYFYVRGAPPNDNGYFIDGIRVPLLFHVGIGQGVIHPALVDRVDVHAGAPPAGYGGFIGAIIAGQTRDPAPAPHGEANLRLVDAGALVETPFADGRGSALLAGRYGYPGPILGAFTSVKLGYWDYQSRLTWRLAGQDSIGLFAFGSHDYLATVTEQTGAVVKQFGSDFHRLDLRYDHPLPGGHLRLAATVGHDTQGGAGGNDGGPVTITDRSAAVRLEVDDRLSYGVRFRGGLDARIDDYGLTQGAAPPGPMGSMPSPTIPSSADPPPVDVTGGAHAEFIWRVASRLELVPGARVYVFGSSRPNPPAGAQGRTMVPAFDPRLSARVIVTPSVALLSTVGLSHQYPALRVGPIPGPFLTVPGFPFGSTQLQTAAQASAGVEVALPGEVVLTATGFLSRWWGLTDLTATCIQPVPAIEPFPPMARPYVCPSNAPVPGQAYGLELLARRSLAKRVSGWLSYTLSRSRRQAHYITPSGEDVVVTVPSDGDRRHVLNAMLAYDLGRHWRAGVRLVFYTGTPFSKLEGNVPVPPYNAYRNPVFYRVDLRLEKRWSLGKGRSVALVIEGQNVNLHKEVQPFGLNCMGEPTSAGQTTQCTQGTVGPITLPSVGVEAFF